MYEAITRLLPSLNCTCSGVFRTPCEFPGADLDARGCAQKPMLDHVVQFPPLPLGPSSLCFLTPKV